MKKLLLLVVFFLATTALFSQVINGKIYLQVVDEKGEKQLVVRPLPSNQNEWTELTNYLIEIYDVTLTSITELQTLLNEQNAEITTLENKVALLEEVNKQMSTQVNIASDISTVIMKKKFQLFYGIQGEYTYLGNKDALYGIGFGLRWLGLALVATPSLRIYDGDGSPSFAFGLRLSYWF